MWLAEEVRTRMGEEGGVEFGLFLTPDATDPGTTVRRALLAERLGLELLGIQDHPYQRRFLDTWTLLSVLAGRTERITLFTDVANLPLRPPAMLAKAAASLDLLSGGRVELGLGAGAFWAAIGAMGGPVREPRDAVSALEEAIGLIRLFWTGGRALRFEGKFYELAGAHGGPVPAHAMGIWLGAYGPRMLRMTGRLADGWLPSSGYAAPEKLREMNARIDEAAVAAERSPSDIRRLYNVWGRITTGAVEGFAAGPVESWVDDLTRLALDERVDGFVVGFEGDEDAQLRLLGEEVAPRVRANVARAGGVGRAGTG